MSDSDEHSTPAPPNTTTITLQTDDGNTRDVQVPGGDQSFTVHQNGQAVYVRQWSQPWTNKSGSRTSKCQSVLPPNGLKGKPPFSAWQSGSAIPIEDEADTDGYINPSKLRTWD